MTPTGKQEYEPTSSRRCTCASSTSFPSFLYRCFRTKSCTDGVSTFVMLSRHQDVEGNRWLGRKNMTSFYVYLRPAEQFGPNNSGRTISGS